MSVHHSIDNTALSASVKRQYCPSTEKSYDFRKVWPGFSFQIFHHCLHLTSSLQLLSSIFLLL
ncbi:hypothetical protein HanIR_Chr06g0270951 [Helianthus annuus]|nr:hypothetical protein HanIR_Chr06g0270951 [Helianthus annuus]